MTHIASKIALVTLIASGCYLKQLPITDAIARASTYQIAVQLRDGSERRGDAWAIDEHHLITAGGLCAHAENIVLLLHRDINGSGSRDQIDDVIDEPRYGVKGGRDQYKAALSPVPSRDDERDLEQSKLDLQQHGGIVPILARLDNLHPLCLLDVPASVRLGSALVLARAWHRRSAHLGTIGSPVWSAWGVVGIVLRIEGGRVVEVATHAEIAAFARAQGVAFEIAPPSSDIDMDISCQQGAKAMGWCSTFEPHEVVFPGEK